MNELQFTCHTCDYFHPVVNKIQKTLKFKNNTDDEIFGLDQKTEKTESESFKYINFIIIKNLVKSIVSKKKNDVF
jgi:hypothetical protein